MKPVCKSCQRFYRPKRNGYFFIEGMPIRSGAQPGTQEPQWWKPYKIWSGDLWQCQGCGHELVVGVIGGPIREHYQPDFDSVATSVGATQLQVNDC